MAIAGASLARALGLPLQAATLPLAQGPMGFASEILCGGAVLMLISLILGEQFWGPPQPVGALAWVYWVAFDSQVAFSAYLYRAAHTSPVLATRYAFANPAFTLFIGVVLGGEVVHSGEWIASGIILTGVLLILAAKTRQGTLVARPCIARAAPGKAA
jgi:drug/metabolite transporter (DMT)-like permease